MILLLGGTTEGRDLGDYLHRDGFELILSTATDFPAPNGKSAVRSRAGRLSQEGLETLLEANKIKAVVDATHPFAKEVSRLARQVCGRANVPYLRFERGAAAIADDPGVTVVDGIPAAAAACSGKVFLATGAKTIGQYVRTAAGAEFFARVLPWPDSLRETLRWLPADHIIAAMGPFTFDFNKACFALFGAGALVTKDSGTGSGIEEKIAAALELEMKVIVIERPAMGGEIFTGYEAVAARLRGTLNG